MLGAEAWLTSAWSGLGSGAPFPSLTETRRNTPYSSWGLGRRETQTQRGFLLRPPSSHPPLTSTHRALAPGCRGTQAWAHTLTPRFVYLGSCISCLAKPHGRLNPGRHKPTQSPWQSLQKPIRHPITASALSSPTHIIPFDEASLAQIGLHCGGSRTGLRRDMVPRVPLWRGWAGRELGRRRKEGGQEGSLAAAHIAPAPASPEVWCSYSPQGAGRSVSARGHLPFKSASSRSACSWGLWSPLLPMEARPPPQSPALTRRSQHFLLRASFCAARH